LFQARLTTHNNVSRAPIGDRSAPERVDAFHWRPRL